MLFGSTSNTVHKYILIWTLFPFFLVWGTQSWRLFKHFWYTLYIRLVACGSNSDKCESQVRQRSAKQNLRKSLSVCGECHWLAHPPSQDILSSGHHNLINTETAVVSASGNCKVESVWCETDQEEASDQLQRLYVPRGIVLCAHTIVHVRVYCVCVCVW
jgi:hypothetical protein